MNIETYIRAQMAKFAMDEGLRHGGINNTLAVAHVLRNRVFSGWGDWIEVVTRAPDKRGTIYPPEPTPLRSNNVRVILMRIDEIYSNPALIDLTGGALFYFDPTFSDPEPWFKTEILERPDDHARSAHVGPVWFFK